MASLGWRWPWWAPARWVALGMRVRLDLTFKAARERGGRLGKGRGTTGVRRMVRARAAQRGSSTRWRGQAARAQRGH